MAKARFIHFYGTFKDLYEWGRGWASMSVQCLPYAT